MRLRVGLVIGLIATISLAGCFEEGDIVPVEGSETGGDGGSVTTDPGNQTGEGDDGSTVEHNVTNTPPVANLTADVVNGTAPLSANFTLDGTDADGDALAWILVVNGTQVANGTVLPAQVTHVFESAGSFLIVLNVTDGNASANATLTLDVAAPAPSGPFAEVTASWAVGNEGPMLADYLECSSSPASGTSYASLALPAGAGGRSFTASISAETGLESIPDWGFYVFNSGACDGTDEEFFGEIIAPVGGGVTGTVSGTIPATADFLTAYSNGGGMVELVIIIH